MSRTFGCDRCDRLITGGRVEVKIAIVGGATRKRDLCATCASDLTAWFKGVDPAHLASAIGTADAAGAPGAVRINAMHNFGCECGCQPLVLRPVPGGAVSCSFCGGRPCCHGKDTACPCMLRPKHVG